MMRRAITALVLLLVTGTASAQFRKLGELELRLTGLNAVATPEKITVPKNTTAGVRVSVRSGAVELPVAEAARLLGGTFQIEGELAGPGLPQTILLPQTQSGDPYLLIIPPLPEAGHYTISNLRLARFGATVLDIAPQKIAVEVIDQVLITSVTTRPLTLEEIQQKGIILDSNSYLGFEFTLGVSLDSKVTQFTFPVVFDKRGVAVPQPSLPTPEPERALMPPLTTVVPMLLKPPEGVDEPTVRLPNGQEEPVRIPSVLVIPGNVGYLKQFFSAKLFVANGAPGGSGLSVFDVIGKIKLPAGADRVPGNLDDPLALPDTTSGPQLPSQAVRGVGIDGRPGTADDVGRFAPSEQGEVEFLLRGDKEGFHQIDFDVEAMLDGLLTGPVKVTGSGSGGVLVRNPYFSMTFTAPAQVRQSERFTLYVTVNNISQSIANNVSVTLDQAAMSGARLVSPTTQTIPTLLARDSAMIPFEFIADRTGQLTATYLNFDTQNGTTGNLKFTLGIGERGIPLSPDTLVLPASTDFVPLGVRAAAMRVLGQAWSIANAPSGTLPPGVVRTTRGVVTQKALALAEAGLRISLGQQASDAVRDLLFDFYGGSPLDAGFDQLLRTTNAGSDFARAVGVELQQIAALNGGAAGYERTVAQIAASGADFMTFAIGSATEAPVTIALTDAQNQTGIGVSSAVIVPFGTSSTAPKLGLIAAPTAAPYTLDFTATATGTVDLSVTIPNRSGAFVRGTSSVLSLIAGARYRVTLDPANASALALNIDQTGDGTYETSQPMTTETLVAQGPRLLSATIIGPETLPGAGPFGFNAALLFDRIVDGTSASSVNNYSIAKNKVVSAKKQLSGRMVFATLDLPEGPYVSTRLAASNIRDGRQVVGPPADLAVGSRLTDVGAVVTGRVLNADGSPVTGLKIIYSQNAELTCAPPLDDWAGMAAVTTADDGSYELRYVRQDACGMPFQITTSDPSTGAVRTVMSSVRTRGEQIVLDIALFGRGSVTGVIKTLTGSPVAGASVVAVSQTDTQSSGSALSDSSGRYRIDNIIVGPISVKAVKGISLGRASGRIDRAGTAATVDLTLDGGTVKASGVVRRLENGVTSVIPAVQVVYYLKAGDGIFLPLAVTQTNSTGAYSFEGLPTGEYRIEAAINTRDRASASGIAAAGDVLTKDITIVIGGAGYGTVRGVVRFPDGAVAANVIVGIDDRGVLTAANGTFELTGVVTKLESQRIFARSRDGLREGMATVQLTQPNQIIEQVVVILSGIGAAEFTVLDENRNPVPSQQVALLSGCANPCGCSAKTTGSDGRVRFEGIPLGQVRVRAFRTGPNSIDQADATATLTSDGGTAFGVMQFSGFGTITGTVLNPDGSPALGADVHLVAKVFFEEWCSLVAGTAQRVRTDSAGKFRFNGVNTGEFSVTASHPFFTTKVGARGTIVKSGDTFNFTLRLVNTISGVLSGKVYLPDGVTPAGAGVEVTATGPLPDVTVTTNEAGYYEFAKIFPEGTYTVTTRDTSTGGLARELIYLRAQQDITHDFRLKGRGTVQVKVVNAAGQFIPTAFVRLEETEFPNRIYEASLDASNLGIATFHNVYEGRLTATASDPFNRGGRASSMLTTPGGTVLIQVALTTTGTVKGRFLKSDGTTPIPFGAVKLVANGSVVGQTTTLGTGDVGTFTFTYVPSGQIRVEAQDPQTARSGVAVGALTSEGEIVTVDVIAQGIGRVQGIVTSNGVPQPGAHVDIDSGGFHACAIADSTGTYAMDGVPEGRVVATASLSGGFLTGTASAVLSGDGAVLNLPVALRDSGNIAGRVFAADGVTAAPLSLVTVTVGGTGGATLSTTTDPQGNFSIERVPAGAATIRAEVLGGIDRATMSSEIVGSTTTNVTLKLNGVGSINGTALDSGGQPIAGDVTIIGSGAFPYSITVQSNLSGVFALPTVLAGPFSATLRAKSGEFFLYGTASGSVSPNQSTPLTIQVQPSGTVTALVYRSNGSTPAVGSNVILDLLPNRGRVALQVGSDGRFTARGVPLGDFAGRIEDPITTGLALFTGKLETNGETKDLGNITLDDTPLTVVSVTPANGAIDVPINQPVSVTFSNVLQNAGGVLLYDGNTNIGGSPSLSADGKTITLTGTWPDSKIITVYVSTAVTDKLGRHPLTASSTTFRTVDLSAPKVDSIVPANNAIQIQPASIVTVTFNEPVVPPTDVANLIALSSAAGPVSGTVAQTSPTVATFTPAAPLSIDTRYTVTVNGATDAAGNKQTVAFTSTFATTDTVMPQIVMTQPAPGAWLKNARPLIQFSLADSLSGIDVNSGTLTLNNLSVTPVVNSGTLSFTPATDVAEGQQTAVASIADRAGNRNSASGSFSIDVTAPSAATISGVTNGQLLKGTITLSASATDALSGVQKIEILADGALALTLTSPFSSSFDTKTLADGVHVLTARATDLAGNVGPIGPAVTIEVDNAPLILTITAPQPNQPFRDSVTATASVSRPVSQINFQLGTQQFSATGAPYQATFSLIGLAAGPQSINVTAFGLDGQIANAAVTFLVDRTAPAVPDTSRITAEPATDGTAAVFGQPAAVEGNARVEVRNINNGAVITAPSNADGSFVATIQGAQDDILSLVAIDLAGNRSAPASITVSRNPSLPVVSWACSTTGAMYPTGYAAKLRVFALGNNQGITTNTVQKVEFFINNSTTPVLGTAVTGVPNNYETTYTVNGADGTVIPVRAVVTNTSGATAEASTSMTIVSGVTLTANTTIDATNSTYDGQTLIIRSGTTTIIGEHSFAKLIVLDGATLTHPLIGRISIGQASAGDVFVSCTGAINVNGKGYNGSLNGGGSTEPGTGNGSFYPSGGSHGGQGGGGSPAATYGSPFDPNTMGGGGASHQAFNCGGCAAGGGVARIKGNRIIVDGRITSNGAAGGGVSSGAGGSIRIDANVLSGGGGIHADGNGRFDFEAAGGGGRIAIYYQSLSFDRSKVTAAGGTHLDGGDDGAAGTIYYQQVDATGTKISDQLVIDNLGVATTRATGLPLIGIGSVASVSGATVTLASPATIPAWVEGFWIEFLNATAVPVSRYRIASRTAPNTIVLQLAAGETVANVPVPGTYRGVYRFDQLTAKAYGAGITMTGVVDVTNLSLVSTTITHPVSSGANVHRLLFETETMNVDAASAIDVSGRGYANVLSNGETYPGVTPSSNKAGGSHGGRGGPYIGTPGGTYGSITDPNTAGAAGSGGNCFACAAGGGIVRINADNLILNGRIWANAGGVTSGGFSSGAGGSVRIDAASFSGAGEVRAEGNGRSDFEGAGGGGRIAVYYQLMGFDKTKITAAGGANVDARSVGSPGSVYFREIDTTGAKVSEQLVYDNRGRISPATLPFAQSITGTIVGVAGATVTVSGTLPEGIESMLVEFFNNSGTLVSTYRIAARTSATTMTLELPLGQSQANVSIPGTYRVVWRFDDLVLKAGSTMELSGVLRARKLSVSNNTALTHPIYSGSINRLVIEVEEDFTIDSTSRIDVSGKGFNSTLNGGGLTWNGYAGGAQTGGSYGGEGGGAAPMPTYGSAYDPDLPGSAGTGPNCGNCGAGGGIARVKARNFVLDGKVLSNAGPVLFGGLASGSGGSVRIDAETFAGLGSIEAQGNARSDWEGAGGGGRVAVYYTTMTFNRANINAAGGNHLEAIDVGAPGTIFLKSTLQPYGEMIIDNKGRVTQKKTTLPSIGTRTISAYSSTAGTGGPIDTLTATGANYPFPDHLRGLRLFLGTDAARNWVVLRNDQTSVRVDVSTDLMTPAIGQTFRGLVKLDAMKLRQATVVTQDKVEVLTPIDNDGSATITSPP